MDWFFRNENKKTLSNATCENLVTKVYEIIVLVNFLNYYKNFDYKNM